MTAKNDIEDKINPIKEQSAEFNDCSVSCGKGVRKHWVKCDQRKRSEGKTCSSGVDSYVEKVECVNPSCPG